MPPKSEDSAEQPVPADAEDSARDSQDRANATTQVAGCFERAYAVLRALVAGVESGDALAVATDRTGFPVAQRVLRRSRDLPRALVIGRHNRCALSILSDNRVSLRHALLTAWSGDGPTVYRGYDLGGRTGLLLADGQRVPGFSFSGHGLVCLGRTVVFVAPGGPRGLELLSGTGEEAFRNLTGLDATGAGASLVSGTIPDPSLSQLVGADSQEYGGYRGVDPETRPQRRGVLRLRSTQRAARAEDVAEIELDNRKLQRGLLIGRYKDRCALAGHGRNLSRVHALVAEETPHSLLVYDLSSTNGVRPFGLTEGPSHAVVRLTQESPVMLGHFELGWVPDGRTKLH